MLSQELIEKISVSAIPLLLAITLHESAHGYVARFFGDPTAEQAGRISLNPIKHIDPIGTILFPALLLIIGPYAFGWAKPVPVNANRLRHPKQNMLWVAAAGPAANLIMAIGWIILFVIFQTMVNESLINNNTPSVVLKFFIEMCLNGVIINVVLIAFNLLPIPPLDGGRIVTALLPGQLSARFSRLEPFGLPILMTLVITGLHKPYIGQTLNWVFEFVHFLNNKL